MNLTVENITPAQAKKYLELNTKNRKVRKLLVNEYARTMANGQWKLTHQGIAFDCNGILLDGQHRLYAIIESNVPVQMLVARNINSLNQLVMDDHAKRDASDALSLARDEKITQKNVAAIRAAVQLGNLSGRKPYGLTKQELDELIDVFRPAINFVDNQMPTNTKGITSAPVKAAIVLAWFYVDDLPRLELFCGVLTGRFLPDGGGDRAAVTLREWLLRNGMYNSGSFRLEGFKKTQRAIVAFLGRKDIGKLYGTNVYYPWPLADPIR